MFIPNLLAGPVSCINSLSKYSSPQSGHMKQVGSFSLFLTSCLPGCTAQLRLLISSFCFFLVEERKMLNPLPLLLLLLFTIRSIHSHASFSSNFQIYHISNTSDTIF